MIALAAVITVVYLGGVAAAIYGLSRLADTNLFTWDEDDR